MSNLPYKYNKFTLRGRMVNALLVAVFFGVPIPCLLTWWHRKGTPFDTINDDGSLATAWDLGSLLGLILLAGFFCGPFALCLGGGLMSHLRANACIESHSEKSAIIRGAWIGIVLAFLNLPGYCSINFFPHESIAWLRIIFLFAVPGATCGAWIGWQAYKEMHPERGIIPRFSLRTLIFLVLGWGTLLALFQPMM